MVNVGKYTVHGMVMILLLFEATVFPGSPVDQRKWLVFGIIHVKDCLILMAKFGRLGLPGYLLF